MGGPARLSRLDMAQQIAAAWGFSTDAIVSAPASSVQRQVKSPQDISMDSSRLEADLSMKLTAFSDALKQIQQSELSSADKRP